MSNKSDREMLEIVLKALINTNESLREADSVLDGFAEMYGTEVPPSVLPQLNDMLIGVASLYLMTAEMSAEA